MINASSGPLVTPSSPIPPSTVSVSTPPGANVNVNVSSPAPEPVKPLRPKKRFNLKAIVGGLLLIFFVVTGAVALYESGRLQNVFPRADGGWCTGKDQCPAGWNWGGGDGFCEKDLAFCSQGSTNPPPVTNPPPAQSCPDYQKSKPDTGSVCTAGCCQPGNDSTCPSGQKCNIANGYCNSGTSCNANSSGGVHKACDNNQCVNQPCPGNAASCADDCSACSGNTNPPPTGNLCDSSPVTASNCRGIAVGTTIDNFCQCQRTTGTLCACVPVTKLANGLSCTADENCISNYCDPANRICAAKASDGTFSRVCYNNPINAAQCNSDSKNFPTAAAAQAYVCPAAFPLSVQPAQCRTGETNKTCYDQFCQTVQVASSATCPSSHPLAARPATCQTPPGGSCLNPGQGCETGSCCTGSVCQGSVGSRVCQVQDAGFCGTGTCTGYYSFQCSSLHDSSNGQAVCQDNPQNNGTNASAAQSRAAATGCGQWDQVCVGGAKNGQLCGAFAIIKNSCGNNPPASTPPASTPPVSTPPGPVCLAISMTNITQPNALPTADPKLGDAVRFTCGTVPGITHYAFQVVEPGSAVNKVPLQATGNTSATYTITKPGKFYAQCQICTGVAATTCLPFEATGQSEIQ